MAMLAEVVELVIGVDTHKHTHTAAVVVAATGVVLEQATVPATPAGYRQLLGLADRRVGRRVWAIEGTGGYGAGLTRFLAGPRRAGDRAGPAQAGRPPPRRQVRSPGCDQGGPRGLGPRPTRPAKSRRPARSAPGAADRAPIRSPGRHRRPTPTPRARRRRTRHPPQPAAWPDHTPPSQHLRAAPATDPLGHRDHRNRGQPARPGPPHPPPEHRDRRAHPSHHRPGPGLAPRAAHADWGGPDRGRRGVVCLVHPGRCHTDAAFAMLGGAAPIPASSGQTVRVRLNRSGDRHLNQALHLIVLTRLRYDPATRAYAQRRRAQGKTNREIKRCLVRYVARQLYRLLETQPALDPT